jgi:predicted dehydrogenase
MKNMKKTYAAAIIGAGRIGAGFDAPLSRRVLTYAHAFKKNARTSLLGFVDTDATRAEREANRWKTRAVQRLEDLCAGRPPDIIVIATPDDTHEALLLQALSLKPRIIVCEKPIAQSINAASLLREKITETNIPVIVNFSRRFDPTVRRIRRELIEGMYGEIISASCIYVRGTIHNGSHFIDLARSFFGELRMYAMQSCVEDYSASDPTVGGYLSFERCDPFYLIPGDGGAFSMAEFDILTEKGRIRFSEEGQYVTLQQAVDDPVWKGFRALGRPRTKKTQLLKSMTYLIRHVVAVLDGTEQPESTALEALDTNDVCVRLVESLKER